jgi:hypothetical protein
MQQKKVISKTFRKYALFSLLLMFVKLVLLINFFLVHFLTTLSTDSKIFKVILVLFQTLKPNAEKTAKKIKKTYFVNVS